MANQNFTNKEIATALLNAHKLGAEGLTHLVLESTDLNIRQDAIQVLNRTFQHQKMIWDYMSNKGYYQVDMAPQQDISRAQEQLQQSGMQ